MDIGLVGQGNGSDVNNKLKFIKEELVMKSTRKVVALLLAVMMLVTLFAGCGGNQAKAVKDEPTQAETTKTEETTQAAEPTPEPAKELEGTININTQAGPGEKEAWEAAAQGYMEKHPKVKVVVDLKPAEGYGEWIKNMFGSANPAADIVNINMAGPAATGKDVNFMEYINSKSPYSDGIWMDQFNFELQGGKDLARNTWNNLSLQSVQVLWCYNRDIFKKVGIEPPKNWNELKSVSEKLLEAGYQPIASAGDFTSFWAGQMGWLAQIYVDQTTRSQIETYKAMEGDYNYDPGVDSKFKFDPNDPYNDDPWKVNQNPVRFFKALKEGKITPDSEGLKTVMGSLGEVFPKYAGGKAFFGTKDALPLFYQGKAAMFIDGAWRLAMFKNDMDKLTKGEEIKSGENKVEGVQKFELGTFNMPSMEGAGIEAPARTIEVAVGFLGAVKKDKAHDDLVMDFLMYYSSKDGYSKFMSAGLKAGAVPAGPTLVYGVELPPEYASLFTELKFIGNVQKGYGQAIARGAPNDVQESLRDWYQYTQDLLNGKIKTDDWGKKHKENVMKYLKDSLKAAKINESDLDNPQNAPTGK
jgi:raffinose/stachyose/melibiose transport system substrate-binding protein